LERTHRHDELGLVERIPESARDVASASRTRAASAALAAGMFGIHADITPDELRNVEIRESFRGYHRSEVDALCERAAETIERLLRQRALLEERLESSLESRRAEGGRAPQAATYEVSPETAREIDVIQRTLAMAQRAADETLADAEARALALTGEAEARAQALVSDAESEARRIADVEQRRVAAELAELGSRRDVLSADVGMLERFATDYRERIRIAIDAELERLDVSAVAAVEPPPAPVLQGELRCLAALEPSPAEAGLDEDPSA
jgi:DivIVA domain-containing protein